MWFNFFSWKKGEINWEIAKVIIAIVLMAVLGLAVALLFTGKGGEVFASIKNVFRFGQA